jgi:DNA end-binding protein Ku
MPTACPKRPRTSSASPEVVIKNPSSVPPAARSSWSGTLKLGAITVPLKGYSAAVTQRDSPLHLVHLGCGSRIQQPRRCPKHGEIPAEQIVKAFEFAPDDDIVLTEDELNQLKANDDQIIHVERLLSARQFDLFLLSGRTLNLIPAHAAAADAYQLVVAALARAAEWGLGRLVMSDRQQLIGLRVVDQRLALHVLHWPAQWRACPAFEAPKPPALSDVERLSASLAPLRKSFEWSDFQDDFDQKLTDLVSRKLAARQRGKPAVVVKGEPTKSAPRRTTTPRSGRAA